MKYLSVAIGGCLGACSRQLITLALSGLHFPWATLLINLAGSAFLTWFYTITQERISIDPTLRLGIGTGFVGAFTTFSTFTVDGWKLYTTGHPLSALLYIGSSILLGLAGAWLGYGVAHRQSSLRFSEGVSKNQ